MLNDSAVSKFALNWLIGRSITARTEVVYGRRFEATHGVMELANFAPTENARRRRDTKNTCVGTEKAPLGLITHYTWSQPGVMLHN